MNVEGSQSREIREQLTHTIPAMHPNQSNEIICDVATIKTGIISIPIGAQHLIPKHYEIVDKRTIKEANLTDETQLESYKVFHKDNFTPQDIKDLPELIRS